MDQSFESFYCDCAICKGHYPDFNNSYESIIDGEKSLLRYVLEKNHWNKVSESSSTSFRRDTYLQKSVLRRKMTKISKKKHIKQGKKGDKTKTFLRVQKRIHERKMKE
jgi:hypothetical protein